MREKVLIFCAGYSFLKFLDVIKNKYDIVALTDNDEKKWGELIGGLVCCKPSDIASLEYESVLVASENIQIVQTIEKQLCDMKIYKKVLQLSECCIGQMCLKNSEYKPFYNDLLGNEIVMGEGVNFQQINLYVTGTNNRVILHNNVTIVVNLDIYIGGSDNVVEIGERTSIVSAHIDVAEKGSVQIGTDCMISSEVDIYQSATHPIFDINNGKRVNESKDIFIGNHVWLGKRVGLMSGFCIVDGSIVGYGSVSAGVFKENVTIAGNPAKILRENVEWRRDGVGLYELDIIDKAKVDK